MNIMLLGSGTQALAVIKSIHRRENLLFLLTVVSDRNNYGDVSRYVKSFYTDFDIHSNNYFEYVKQLIIENHIDVVLPMGDSLAEFLSLNKKYLLQLAKFVIPDIDIFKKGYDKNLLMKLCKQRDYPHPMTVDLSELGDSDYAMLKDFPYPAMLKPNCTTGGRGMVLLNGYDDFISKYPELHKKYGEYHLQKYIKKGGRQIKVQLYIDEEGNITHHSVLHKLRWYPISGGSSCCSVSIEDTYAVEICSGILKDLQWVGFADFDMIEDPDTGQLMVMEINPRIPACIGAAIASGMDWPNILVDESVGNNQVAYIYQSGHYLRHLGFDFLWFLKTKNWFKAKPGFFSMFKNNISFQDMSDWKDPLPFIKGTYHNIKKLNNADFRKSKMS